MKKYKYCIDCGKEINSNSIRCSDCVDIFLFGSKEKARKAEKKNFKNLKI